MSEASKTARAAMKAKAKRMAEGDKGRVDASSWEPEQTFSAEKKLGPRPLNPREYRRGGKVVEHMEGRAPSEKHAGKMARHPAHDARIGNKGNYEGGTRPTGGRIAKAEGGAVARKSGGKTGKGKTNINIIIGSGHGGSGLPAMPPQMPQAIRPPGMMPPAPPPGSAPPGMPPGGPPGAPPMNPVMAGLAGMGGGGMPRKSGGRAKSYKDMTASAANGEGRLQKTEIAERD